MTPQPARCRRVMRKPMRLAKSRPTSSPLSAKSNDPATMLRGKTVEMHSGDSVVVAGDVEHEARALEETEVLDVFTPYREDYE